MGTDEILGVWVNMIGATTPDLVKTALPQDAIGGGLSSRIIFIYEEKKGKVVPFPFLQDGHFELGEKLEHDLNEIHLMAGDFRFTEDFMEVISCNWNGHPIINAEEVCQEMHHEF